MGGKVSKFFLDVVPLVKSGSAPLRTSGLKLKFSENCDQFLWYGIARTLVMLSIRWEDMGADGGTIDKEVGKELNKMPKNKGIQNKQSVKIYISSSSPRPFTFKENRIQLRWNFEKWLACSWVIQSSIDSWMNIIDEIRKTCSKMTRMHYNESRGSNL